MDNVFNQIRKTRLQQIIYMRMATRRSRRTLAWHRAFRAGSLQNNWILLLILAGHCSRTATTGGVDLSTTVPYRVTDVWAFFHMQNVVECTYHQSPNRTLPVAILRYIAATPILLLHSIQTFFFFILDISNIVLVNARVSTW
jgi:hypothetical protein